MDFTRLRLVMTGALARRCLGWMVLVILLQGPLPARGIFHLAVIDEVMTSYDGDPEVQFVEIRMLAVFQLFLTNTVIGAFGADGAYLGDVLVLPDDVTSHGPNIPWIMGTSAFAAASGLTPDFIIPATLPTVTGMVCWGAPGNGLSVPDPASWDHADPDNYTDCLAYGGYSGPTKALSGAPTSLTADGHSLQRISETEDNAVDFSCVDEATPVNNASESASLPATTSCPVCGNGSLETPAEECDGSEDQACAGQCQVDCTCPVVCGDNVAEIGEACDGTDDASCPGECLSDCTCPIVLDHYKCYKAKDLKNPKFSTTSVNLSDRFGVNDGEFEVKKPTMVCVPVDQNGQGVQQPNGTLTCYQIKGPKLDKSSRPSVQVDNEFGTSQLEASKTAMVCVPSSLAANP